MSAAPERNSVKRIACSLLAVAAACLVLLGGPSPAREARAEEAHGASAAPPMYQGRTAREWVEALHDQPGERRLAAVALGKLGVAAAEAIPDLIEALSAEDDSLRLHAAEALGLIGRKAKPAVPRLVELLHDDNPMVCEAAAQALGRMGRAAEEALPALAEVAQDPRADLRKAAERAQQKIERVHPGVTALFAALLVAMILALALEEKLHAKKSIITGIAAVVTLFLGVAFGIMPNLHEEPVRIGDVILHLPLYVTAVEWEVIAIILGASLFVDVTSKSGIFTWVAVKLTKRSGGDPLALLIAYGVLTVLFSAFLNNVTAMIIVGSLTAVSLRRLGMQDKLLGFLLVEALMTNVGGLLTLISSVPNIIVGQTAGISFGFFVLVAAPYVALATAVSLWLGKRRFGIARLATDEERARSQELVDGFDENDGIEKPWFFWLSSGAFALFILVLASASVLPVIADLGMGFVALGFAAALLLLYKSKVDKFYAAVDWDLLAFFASLFVVINVMEHAQVLLRMGEALNWLLGFGESLGTVLLLVASAVLSSVTDNIPLAAMLAKILAAKDPALAPEAMQWWAVIFGSNLGGNITPIGSASTVVAVTIMHKHEVPLSFMGFVKTAVPFALVQLALAAGYVLLLQMVLGLIYG